MKPQCVHLKSYALLNLNNQNLKTHTHFQEENKINLFLNLQLVITGNVKAKAQELNRQGSSSQFFDSSEQLLVGRAESFLGEYVSQHTVGNGIEFFLLYQTCSSRSMTKIKCFVLKVTSHLFAILNGTFQIALFIVFAWREEHSWQEWTLSLTWIWRLNSIPWAGWQVLSPPEPSHQLPHQPFLSVRRKGSRIFY